MTTSKKYAAFGVLVIFMFLPFLGEISLAEPWLANRVSQNCAACHSPSRRNLPTADRRCTLSCQGCHVNPSGGGLRNQYGKWHEKRWLNSFRSDHLRNEKRPAPLQKQAYAKQPRSFKGKKVPKKWKIFSVYGPSLVETDSMDIDEKKYDRSDKQEQITATRSEFLMRVTKEDPYRLERENTITAGGDFRYIYLSQEVDRDGDVTEEDYSFPMAFDFGLRYRPVQEKVSLVFESRFLNGPTQSDLEAVFTNEARVRSAYALVDDLPYNSYVQFGLYRPLFGNYNPDHTTLASNVAGLTQRSIYKSFSLGASPNVPFVNLHVIQKIFDEAYSQDEGVILNIGGRWVTLGASLMYSYWGTNQSDANGDTLDTTKHSLSGGFMIYDFIVNAEYLHVEKEFAPDSLDKGSVYTAELKYRAWRENYLQASYAVSDVTRTLGEGEVTEMRFGTKHFLFPGSELEFLWINSQDIDKSGDDDVEVNTTSLQAQVHLYF